jgi:pimeloyl-ACP methyl ester carboxylesterase
VSVPDAAPSTAEVAVSEERIAKVGEIELCYQSFGDPGRKPMLLIMGLGSQMILWPDGLCRMLAERGFLVIRFDNRDVGRSTKLSGTPSLTAAVSGQGHDAPYTLDDMAADAAGLLGELGIEAAHVAGASQGGMIAQTLAIRHPERVISMASIMSTTGDRRVGQAHPEAIPALMTRLPHDRESYVSVFAQLRKAIGSPGFEVDEGHLRRLAERCYERGYFPEGTLRQLVAVVASGDRTDELRRLRVPTVVIHGEADPLIDVSGGRATAEAIPDAELLLIDGMGHDLPPGTWQAIVDAVVANTERSRGEA